MGRWRGRRWSFEIETSWLIRAAAICFGLLTLVAAGLGAFLLNSYPGVPGGDTSVPTIWDQGYSVSSVGYLLLVPGAILLMIGQAQVRQMVRQGRVRAP